MHPMVLAGLLALAAGSPDRPLAPDAGLFPAQLVVDLENAPAPEMGYSPTPPAFVEGPGGVFYFFEDDGVHGRELWRSDGTALGTHLVRDVCPGQCDGVPRTLGDSIVGLGSGVMFTADDGVHGTELWHSDGTALGTRLVGDLRPGSASSRIRLLTAAAGQAFFVADDAVHGPEIWRSDGSPAGAFLFAELAAGAAGASISAIAPGNGFLFVGAMGSDASGGLYRVDGSAPLAVRLAAGSMPNGTLKGAPFVTLPDGRLLFQGGAVDDVELWISDGTVAGTTELVDLDPALGGSSSPRAFAQAGYEVYFTARIRAGSYWEMRLFRTDGSVAGTVEIPLPAGVNLRDAEFAMEAVSSRLFFVAEDAAHGSEPWVVDDSGPHLLRDIALGGAHGTGGPMRANLLYGAVGDRYLLVADDGVSGPELWASDGTAAGTGRISSIAPGSAPLGIPFPYRDSKRLLVNGHLTFVRWSEATGRELWWSDGTAAGTVRVATLDAQTSAFFPFNSLVFTEFPGYRCAAAAGPRLVFAAETASRAQATLFGTDGTPAGTVALAPLTGLFADVTYPGCVSTGSSVLHYALDDLALVLQRTDGDLSPTQTLATLGSPWMYSPGLSDPAFVPFGERWIGTVAWETDAWWIESDLTPAGTSAAVIEIPASALAPNGGSLWGISREGVLIGDGTAAGMTLVPPADGLSLGEPIDFAPVGDGALFLGYRASSGHELWRSDGTSPGTDLLLDIAPGAASAFAFTQEILGTLGRPHQLVSAGSVAILSADDGVHGRELWRSDGTAAGTVLLKDIYPGWYPSTPRYLVRVGDVVYFAAEDELHGLELWVTDGTSDGTRLVRDLVPGAESSVPQELTEVKGRLYFTAWRPAWGREAFQTDGTEAGTLQVSDVWPGTGSASPSRFAAVRDTLYFAANDGMHGFELFKVIDPTLLDLFADGFEDGALDAWSRHTSP